MKSPLSATPAFVIHSYRWPVVEPSHTMASPTKTNSSSSVTLSVAPVQAMTPMPFVAGLFILTTG